MKRWIFLIICFFLYLFVFPKISYALNCVPSTTFSVYDGCTAGSVYPYPGCTQKYKSVTYACYTIHGLSDYCATGVGVGCGIDPNLTIYQCVANEVSQTCELSETCIQDQPCACTAGACNQNLGDSCFSVAGSCYRDGFNGCDSCTTSCPGSLIGCNDTPCPSSCGYGGGTVNDGGVNGNCGCTTKSCPATAACGSCTVSPNSATINVGETATITGTTTVSGGTISSVGFVSGTTGVATVSPASDNTPIDGYTTVATGVAPGTSTITATCTTNTGTTNTGTSTVTVRTPSCNISLTPASVKVGETAGLTATVTPTNGTISSVSFTSGSPSKATVSPASDTTVAYTTIATGVAVGTSTITATATMNTGTTCNNTAVVTVLPATVMIQGHHVDVNGTDLVIPGQGVTVTGEPINTDSPYWFFNSLPTGTYTVTATNLSGYTISHTPNTIDTPPPVNSYTAGNSVTVTLPSDGDWADIYFKYTPIPSCNLTLTPATVHVGETAGLTATVTPTNGTISSVSFTSGSPSKATVSPASDTTVAYTTIATGVAVGTSTITATATMNDGTTTCTNTSVVTIAQATVTIEGRYVDVNGNPLVIPGQAVTVTGQPVNTNTPTWFFNSLPTGTYTITATNPDPTNYTISHTSCINTSPPTACGYTAGNSVTVTLPSNGDWADIYFKFTPIPSCSLTLSSTNVYVGGTANLTANVSPVNGTISSVSFTSGSPSKATVSPGTVNASPYTTVATGVAVGTSTITATATMNTGTTCFNTAVVTVLQSAVMIQGHHVNTSGADLVIPGQNVTITGPTNTSSSASPYWNFSSLPTGTYTVTATNPDPSRYTISHTPNTIDTSPPVNSYTAGNSVTVTLPSNGDWADIYFKYTPIPSCTVTPGSATITVGDTATITGNTTVWGDTISSVGFVSGTTGVATVNPASDTTVAYTTVVTGVSAGTSTITARCNTSTGATNTGTSTITVLPATVMIQGHHVNTSGVDLVIPGQGVTITGPVNTSSSASPYWNFSSLPTGTYTVTANNIAGYTTSHTPNTIDTSPPANSYTNGNSVTVTLPSNGDWADIYFKYTPIPSCNLTLTPATVHVGETAGLTATVTPTNGTISSVSFTSGSPSKATVSPASDTTVAYTTIATGVAVGTSTITATATMNTGTTCNNTAVVTVLPATVMIQGHHVNTSGVDLVIPGQNVTITGPVNTSSADSPYFLFNSLPTGTYTVTATNLSGYTISHTPNTIDTSPPVNSYTAGNSVTVTLPSNGDWADIYFKYSASSCTVSLTPATIKIGETATLTATVTPINGTISNVTFTSGTTGVATVSPGSVGSSPYTTIATGISAGTSTITARATMNTGTICSNTAVVTVPPCTVTLTPNPKTMVMGDPAWPFTATLTNITPDSVSFSSSDTGSITVSPGSDNNSSDGYTTWATPLSPPGATLTASAIYNGVSKCSGSSNVTVIYHSGWWQVKDADVSTNGDLNSDVP